MVHSDVWGPLAIPNQNRFKYYVLFVDDYSRMSWLYLMKDRNEVFTKFLLFVNEIHTQFSATIQTFRSDNALEYTHHSLKHIVTIMVFFMRPRVCKLHSKMEFPNENIGTSLKSQRVL